MLYMINENIMYSDISMDFFEVGKELACMVRDNPTESMQLQNEQLLKVKVECKDISTEQFCSQEKPTYGLNRLSLIMTNDCNFACTYCYENWDSDEKLNMIKNKFLSVQDALKAIDLCVNTFGSIQTLMFFGGEPLLRLKEIEEICMHVANTYPLINFGIITNGSIYSKRVMELFKKYHFNITISIDGPAKYHDRCRIDHNHNGTFKLISKNAKAMKTDGLNFMVQGSITPNHIIDNFTVSDYVTFLDTEFKTQMPHIVPCQIKSDDPDAWTYESKSEMINSYIQLDIDNLDNILNKNYQSVKNTSTFIDTLMAIIKKKKFRTICPAGFEAAVSPDGKLYPCFMLVNKPGIEPLGTVNSDYTTILDNTRRYLDSALKINIVECSECWAKHICHGCAGSNYNENTTISIPAPLHCDWIKSRSAAIIVWLNQLQKSPNEWKTFVNNITELSKRVDTKMSC